MSRQKDYRMDRKSSRQSLLVAAQVTSTSSSNTSSASSNNYKYDRQGTITKTTRMKFLSNGGGGSRSPDSAPKDPDDPTSDAAPEGETQLERKRRLNRNNERKKRAKRIMKIEDLTSKFHTLTSENEALKAESKDLKEKIEIVKKFIQEKGKKPAAVLNTPQEAANQNVASLPRPGSLQMSLAIAASTAITHVAAPTRQEEREADQARMVATLNAQATGQIPVDLSFIPREQRITLLQQEFLKQQNILNQLRSQFGEAPAAAAAPVPAPVPVPLLAALPVAVPSQSPMQQQQQQQAVTNVQEQFQMLLSRFPAALAPPAPSPVCPPVEAAPPVPNILEQLQRHISAQTPPSVFAAVVAPPSAAVNEQARTDAAALQQQLILALEAIQNMQRGRGA